MVIADALGVNDKRFLPAYEFYPPEKPGRVEVCVGECTDARGCQPLTLRDSGIAGQSPQKGEAA